MLLTELETLPVESKNTALAIIVALTFYFFSLFSVYQESTKKSTKKMTTNKDGAKCPFHNSIQNKEKTEIQSISNLKPDEIKKIHQIDTNTKIEKEEKINKETHFNAPFNPNAIIKNGKKKKQKKALPKVSNFGSITLEELNLYDCNHPERQVLSVFGTLFDVTEATDKYGPDGAYAEFAGHDITLALGSGKLNQKWLDRFVQLSSKQSECAKGWIPLYQKQYPTCGILDKWSENYKKWPKLTKEELEELNAECIVM